MATIHFQAWRWAAIAGFLGLMASVLPIPLVISGIALAAAASLALLSPITMLALLLVLAPLRTLIQTESTLRLPLDIGQLLTVAFAFSWVAMRAIHRRRIFTFRINPDVYPLLAFILVGIVSWLYAYSLSAAIVESVKWVTIAVMAIFVHYHSGMGRWRIFASMLVVAATANALIGIYIFLGGSGADHLAINNRFFRAFGTFGQPNPFGGFMGLILPLAAGLTWHSLYTYYRSRQIVWLAYSAFHALAGGLISLALLMSWSRGAWLSIVAALLLMCLAIPRKLSNSLALAGAVTGAIALVWVSGIVPDSVTARITSATAEFFAFDDMRGVDINSENYAVVERLAHWQAALNMVTQEPLGVGLGNYETAYAQYRLLNWPFALGHAHNYYLNVLAETGMIGAVVYAAFLLLAIYYAWCGRNHPSHGVRWLAIGLCGGWAYLIFHSTLDNLYVNNVFLHIGVMLGLTYWVHQQMKMGFITE